MASPDDILIKCIVIAFRDSIGFYICIDVFQNNKWSEKNIIETWRGVKIMCSESWNALTVHNIYFNVNLNLKKNVQFVCICT